MSPQPRPFLPRTVASRAVVLAAAAALAPTAVAQQNPLRITFSLDWKSQRISQLDTSPAPHPITEGDLLRPPPGAPGFNVQQPPTILVLGDALSLAHYSLCSGHAAGTQCDLELDALSGGRDERLTPGQTHSILGGGGGGAGVLPSNRWRIWFSVDPYARGFQPPSSAHPHPQVATEGTLGTPPPFEACGDIFCDVGIASGPLAPGTAIPDSVGVFDGNGLPSASGYQYLGLGLLEPNAPSGPPPWGGDNLDALEMGTDLTDPTVTTYFSLDSAFVDPLTGQFNSGSAAANSFVGGDVLATTAAPGGTILRFASATQLGLDRVPGFGPDSDDLDALAIWENGDGVFQPSQVPYDWLAGATDMVIFSVRRGSALINQPDSIFGLPIQPGDLLTTPLAPSAGGLSPYPGIFVAAEHLGLFTARGSTLIQGDELDALDILKKWCFDCNENGVEDAVDIATGASADTNKNGIPDECEDKVVEFCFCPPGSPAPCANFDAGAGCRNSTGVGATLFTNISSGGSTSITADDLVFNGAQMPPNESAILYMSDASKPPTPFEDGLRCIQSPFYRYAIQTTSSSGALSYGPGMVANSLVRFGPVIDVGESWYYQCWYRDPSGPCNKHSNVSNVVKVTYVP